VETNKGRRESRSILTTTVDAEALCFPFVAQAARLRRQTQGRADELVALITSAEPAQLNATSWLRRNREAWGIENGLHQRLDESHNDDRCRVRHQNAMWVLGMMRRLSISLYMQWRGSQRRPEHVTTTDFQAALGEEQQRAALRLVLSRRPSLRGPS
jgi:hypothetical protein